MTKVIHDWSAVDERIASDARHAEEMNVLEIEERMAPLREEAARNLNDRIRAEGERRRKTGLGVLAAGVGVASVIAAVAYLREPKVIETTKVVEKEKIVRVEVPAVNWNAMPAPTVGAKSGRDEFMMRPDYQASTIHGVIKSIEHGVITFDNGPGYTSLTDDHAHVRDWSSTRFNGDPTFCRPIGKNKVDPTRDVFGCFAQHAGAVVDVAPDPLLDTTATPAIAPGSADDVTFRQ